MVGNHITVKWRQTQSNPFFRDAERDTSLWDIGARFPHDLVYLMLLISSFILSLLHDRFGCTLAGM